MLTITVAPLVPITKGVPRTGNNVFSPTAELINGRLGEGSTVIVPAPFCSPPVAMLQLSASHASLCPHCLVVVVVVTLLTFLCLLQPCWALLHSSGMHGSARWVLISSTSVSQQPALPNCYSRREFSFSHLMLLFKNHVCYEHQSLSSDMEHTHP